jgi:hypothetical protein
MPPRTQQTSANLFTTAEKFRTGLSLLLTISLVGTAAAPVFSQTPQTSGPAAVESQVKKFGVGKSVKMALASGEQISGHIRAIGDRSFTVKVSKSSNLKSIPYASVTEIKDPGPLTWILVGAALVIVIILIVHH